MTTNTARESSLATSYLTFSSGTTRFAIDVVCVRFITSSDTINTRMVPAEGGREQTVFNYDGKPIPLYSFCAITDVKSRVEESEELIELLSARKQDHIDWMDALEHSIKTGEPFEKARDPHQCAFGKWYDQYESDDEQLKDILAKFDAPHKHIHSLAGSLLEKCDDAEGRQQALEILNKERFTTMAALLSLFSEASARMSNLTRPVIMILAATDTLFGIRLDGIDGIEEFSNSQWLDDREFEESCSFDGYFQTTDDRLFLNINPGELLKALQS